MDSVSSIADEKNGHLLGVETRDANANGKDYGRSWSDHSIFSDTAAWSSVDRGMNTSKPSSASCASLTRGCFVSVSTAEPVLSL